MSNDVNDMMCKDDQHVFEMGQWSGSLIPYADSFYRVAINCQEQPIVQVQSIGNFFLVRSGFAC